MNSLVRVYVHFVWATWDREKSITSEVKLKVYPCIAAECRGLGGFPIEIGGMEDHVHALVRMPATACIADMGKAMKGGSSHLANSTLNLATSFRWQGSYGAFSVSRDEVQTVRMYIRNQREHHSSNTIIEEYERSSDLADSAPEDGW